MSFQFIGSNCVFFDWGSFTTTAGVVQLTFPAGTSVGDLAILHLATSTKADVPANPALGQPMERYIGGFTMGTSGWNYVFTDATDTPANVMQRLAYKKVTAADLAAPYILQADFEGYEDHIFGVGVYRGVRFQTANFQFQAGAQGTWDMTAPVRVGRPVIMSSIMATGFGSSAVNRVWTEPSGMFTTRFAGGPNKAKWHLADFTPTFNDNSLLFRTGNEATLNNLMAVLSTPPDTGGWRVGAIAGG